VSERAEVACFVGGDLVLNAVQASPAGATVTVSTATSGDTVEVRVRDHGPGLTPAARADLFTPFHTTKSGGTGLGLPVALQILEAHHGTLVLDDAPGGGTEAIARIPAAP